MVLVATQLSVMGSSRPPVFKPPPQMIISLPVHTAVWFCRACGALVMLVAIQLLVPGLYLPPVFKTLISVGVPPQTIISLPVHAAVCNSRPSGALVMLVAVQLSVLGLYFPPVLKKLPAPWSPPRRSFHCRSILLCGRIGQRALR